MSRRGLSGTWAWFLLSILLCAAATSAPGADVQAATLASARLSFQPYAKVSARRVETMRLTREGRFDAVEAILAPLQQAYERGEVDEFVPATAFAAFSITD